jgi:hypothetical protein
MKLTARFLVPISLIALIALIVSPRVTSAQNVMFEQPVLITSAGQSAEITIVSMVFRKLELQRTVDPHATATDLSGIKTLVLVPGFSSKGLGSAGVNREQEMERLKSLIAAAQTAGVKTLVLHLGGKARRGTQSDEFNRVAAVGAQQLIVVKSGDEDQFFSKLAADRKIPITLVDRMSDVAGVVGGLFR